MSWWWPFGKKKPKWKPEVGERVKRVWRSIGAEHPGTVMRIVTDRMVEFADDRFPSLSPDHEMIEDLDPMSEYEKRNNPMPEQVAVRLRRMITKGRTIPYAVECELFKLLDEMSEADVVDLLRGVRTGADS